MKEKRSLGSDVISKKLWTPIWRAVKNAESPLGRPFSGRLVLRMSSELHGRVAFAAAGLGTTINEFINRALADELDCLGLNPKSGAITKL